MRASWVRRNRWTMTQLCSPVDPPSLPTGRQLRHRRQRRQRQKCLPGAPRLTLKGVCSAMISIWRDRRRRQKKPLLMFPIVLPVPGQQGLPNMCPMSPKSNTFKKQQGFVLSMCLKPVKVQPHHLMAMQWQTRPPVTFHDLTEHLLAGDTAFTRTALTLESSPSGTETIEVYFTRTGCLHILLCVPCTRAAVEKLFRSTRLGRLRDF